MVSGRKQKVRIGLFGAGYFGLIHARNLKQTHFEVVGFHDPDPERSEGLSRETGLKWFQQPQELLDNVDAVDIVTTTSKHMEIALHSLRLSKHIFVEKPIAATAEEAGEFVRLAGQSPVKIQVGHIERYNPAFRAAKSFFQAPSIIHSSRLAPYNPRANDVSVVYDLMIHDIDAVLSLVDSEVRTFHAAGLSRLTDHLDICEARLEFENGCIANLLSSRMHPSSERKMRVFMEKAHLEIDFMNRSFAVNGFDLPLSGDMKETGIQWITPKGTFPLFKQESVFSASNAILEELNEFYESIVYDKPIGVNLHDAFKALLMADKIEQAARKFARQ